MSFSSSSLFSSEFSSNYSFLSSGIIGSGKNYFNSNVYEPLKLNFEYQNKKMDNIFNVVSNISNNFNRHFTSVINQRGTIINNISSSSSVFENEGFPTMMNNAPTYAKLPLYTASAITFGGLAVPASEYLVSRAIINPTGTMVIEQSVEFAMGWYTPDSPSTPAQAAGALGSMINDYIQTQDINSFNPVMRHP